MRGANLNLTGKNPVKPLLSPMRGANRKFGDQKTRRGLLSPMRGANILESTQSHGP